MYNYKCNSNIITNVINIVFTFVITISYCMKDRILKFISSENKTSAQFAEEIGVQPSGVSHILSGRNNPSLDFVMKMLHRYPNLSTEWLLFGREPMYKHIHEPTLFDQLPFTDSSDKEILSTQDSTIIPSPGGDGTRSDNSDDKESIIGDSLPAKDGKRIEKIVIFFRDRTFREYNHEG